MANLLLYKILFLCFFSFAISTAFSQKTQSELSVMVDFQYSFTNFGKLHGVNVPVSIQWKIKNNILAAGFGAGYGLSNWNFGNDPSKTYNMDINYTLPPYSSFSSSTFLSRTLIEFNGTSGHGFRWYGKVGFGRAFHLFGKSNEIIIGGYYTRVNTSFIVKEINDQIIYNYLFPNGPDGEPVPFETEFLIPISIIYWDMGPFIHLRREIFEEWKVPLGISVTYYHGYDKNSWINLGVYLDMKVL